MTFRMARILPAWILLAAALFLTAQRGALREQTGPLPGGGFLLNSGWILRPAGKQVPLDTLPMSSALSPDGKFLLVLNGGYNPPSISVMETGTAREIRRVPVPDGWLGLTFTSNGRLVYAGGGARASVFEFTFSPEGALEPARTFELVPAARRTHQDFIGDVALSPDGRLLYAASLYRDRILVVNPQSGRVIEEFKTGRRPYRILFHPDGKSLFVTNWADGTISHLDAGRGYLIATLRAGAHPTDMLWRDRKVLTEPGEEPEWSARLFVAAANTNNVYVFGATPDKDLRLVEAVNVALTPRQPVGMTPSALALSEDQNRMFVVCSDANAVAVVDVSEARSRVAGFIPVGWYPLAARVLPGQRLVVLNGRGERSFPNPGGPNPTRRTAPLHGGNRTVEYVGRLQTGGASFIDPFDDERLEAYTKTVAENCPYRDRLLDGVPAPPGNPVPARPGDPSPIRHVVYIVKENRTYDQVLGALGKGNGDPSLVLFGEKVTPNHHKLAREYVLFDNFYVNSDVSADGHNWSTAAIAPDYVQKLWPNSYGGRRKHYDYEGGDPASAPPAGYLWTNAAARGLTMRNYGCFVTNRPKAGADGIQVETVRDPVLNNVTNRFYRGFDMDYPDVERAKVFLRDLAQFETNGHMPQLVLMRLGNDHTFGTTPGKLSPMLLAADNDYALGLIVEGLSRSKFWPATAIFVLQDDAQNGADHVDSHRAPAFVISPYTRRGAVDSTMYNTSSMLRTMELILGLAPMTVFDAGARPMSAAFQPAADPRPYTAAPPGIPLDERNPAPSATAGRPAAMDFSEAGRIRDQEPNGILRRSIRGADPPAPVRSYFSR